jgi:hypothetical protein
MRTAARIRFSPVTKEIEIEGSEKFVTAYFHKIQEMISGVPSETAKKPKAVKLIVVKKVKGTAKKNSREKKVTNIDKIVGLIQRSAAGISTAELKKKTGLVENQIWNIVVRATKAGKVKKLKRGIYGAA